MTPGMVPLPRASVQDTRAWLPVEPCLLSMRQVQPWPGLCIGSSATLQFSLMANEPHLRAEASSPGCGPGRLLANCWAVILAVNVGLTCFPVGKGESSDYCPAACPWVPARRGLVSWGALRSQGQVSGPLVKPPDPACSLAQLEWCVLAPAVTCALTASHSV